MSVVDDLHRAREAYERREWVAAYRALSDLADTHLQADDFAAPGDHRVSPEPCWSPRRNAGLSPPRWAADRRVHPDRLVTTGEVAHGSDCDPQTRSPRHPHNGPVRLRDSPTATPGGQNRL